MLARDARLDAEAHRAFLEDADAETDRLKRMVDDFVATAEAGRGGLRLSLRLTDVAEVVRDVGDEFARANTDRQVRIRGGEQPIHAEVDSERLRQAVGNLVENAIAYSPNGSPVQIEITATAAEVEIRVRDQGIGIAEDQLEQIFEEFYRVDRRTDGVLRGTGLGLAIVKAVVAAHQGTVQVASDPGKGSTFTVRIPRAAA